MLCVYIILALFQAAVYKAWSKELEVQKLQTRVRVYHSLLAAYHVLLDDGSKELTIDVWQDLVTVVTGNTEEEAKLMFLVMDEDESGSINAKEFLAGCVEALNCDFSDIRAAVAEAEALKKGRQMFGKRSRVLVKGVMRNKLWRNGVYAAALAHTAIMVVTPYHDDFDYQIAIKLLLCVSVVEMAFKVREGGGGRASEAAWSERHSMRAKQQSEHKQKGRWASEADSSVLRSRAQTEGSLGERSRQLRLALASTNRRVVGALLPTAPSCAREHKQKGHWASEADSSFLRSRAQAEGNWSSLPAAPPYAREHQQNGRLCFAADSSVLRSRAQTEGSPVLRCRQLRLALASLARATTHPSTRAVHRLPDDQLLEAVQQVRPHDRVREHHRRVDPARHRVQRRPVADADERPQEHRQDDAEHQVPPRAHHVQEAA
jgi:hypothetical protein